MACWRPRCSPRGGLAGLRRLIDARGLEAVEDAVYDYLCRSVVREIGSTMYANGVTSLGILTSNACLKAANVFEESQSHERNLYACMMRCGVFVEWVSEPLEGGFGLIAIQCLFHVLVESKICAAQSLRGSPPSAREAFSID
jgi:hypothetical protein